MTTAVFIVNLHLFQEASNKNGINFILYRFMAMIIQKNVPRFVSRMTALLFNFLVANV